MVSLSGGTITYLTQQYNQQAHAELTGTEILLWRDKQFFGTPSYGLYQYLAQAIYNLQYCFDPEAIILGGLEKIDF